MSDSNIRLTFAELEFLLGNAPQWPRRRQDLRLNEPDVADDVASAGLASLVARELVKIEGDDVAVAPVVAGAAGLIESSPVWIDMVHVNSRGVSPSRIGLSDDGRTQVIVMPAGAGCFDIIGLTARPGPEQVAAMAAGLLDETGQGSVLIGERGDDDAIGVAVGRQDDGRWSVSDSTSEAPPVPGTREAAVARAAELLTGLVDGLRARSNA